MRNSRRRFSEDTFWRTAETPQHTMHIIIDKSCIYIVTRGSEFAAGTMIETIGKVTTVTSALSQIQQMGVPKYSTFG